MWQRVVSLSAALSLVLQAGTLTGQQDRSPPATSAASLWQQAAWARLEINGGRIVVLPTRCSQGGVVVDPPADSASRQSLRLEIRPPAILVAYEWREGDRRLSLDVDSGGQLIICSTDGDTKVSYLQPASGKVTLEISGKATETDKRCAASLWHLLLIERDLCRQHLIPMIDRLQPSWRLEEQVALIEQSLTANAGFDVLARRRQWETWVDQLASDSFAERQQADHALRSAGQSVLSLLRELDSSQFDAEQRRRIRAILEDVADLNSDSPERVAGWLLENKAVWLAILERGPPELRLAAAEHLGSLVGKPVFDPQATPDQVQAQLTALRAKLAEYR